MNKEKGDIIPEGARHRGQKAAMRSQFLVVSLNMIMLGPVMMLFANDVLKFDAQAISFIAGFAPLLVILRFVAMPFIRRFGLRNTMHCTDLLYATAILLLLFLPIENLSFGVFMAILMLYRVAQVIGPATVWQPLIRDITTDSDRGRFFASMRFMFNTVLLIFSGALAFVIGDSITKSTYDILLIISLIGVANRSYFIRHIPEREHNDKTGKTKISHWTIIKNSSLLRRPLIIMVLMTIASLPLFTVYLRQVLHIPTNIVSAYIFMAMLGSVLSMILWGRIADAIGFKPMLSGLLILIVAVSPVLLLMAPMESTGSFSELSGQDLLTVAVLMLFGLISGAMGAGTGIAATSMQHSHTKSQTSMEEMAYFSLFVVGIQSATAFMGGYVLQSWAVPYGSHSIFDNVIHWDYAKLYILIVLNSANVLALIMLIGLPNIRREFGLSDFFHSMVAQPIRTIYRGRYTFHDNVKKRMETARLLGNTSSPLALDPVIELLDDPSYDVRLEAINTLAITNSPGAGNRLFKMLKNPERRQLWDRVAWAIGELQYKKAIPRLRELLEDNKMANRIRAMAARALAKINDEESIPILKNIMLDENITYLHLRSSSCCALLQLQAAEVGPILFKELDSLRDRFDRYEILALASESLEIEAQWLIASKSDMNSLQMLQREIDFRSPNWQKSNADLISMINDTDFRAISVLFHARIGQHDEFSERTTAMLKALDEHIQQNERWSPTTTLAAAWLLFVHT